MLGALLAHLAASIDTMTGLVDLQREVSEGQAFQATRNFLVTHGRAARQLVDDLHIHFITGVFGQVSNPNHRRGVGGLLTTANNLGGFRGFIGQHVDQ